VLSSFALLGRFAIGAQASLLRQHSAERKMLASACTRSMPGIIILIWNTGFRFDGDSTAWHTAGQGATVSSEYHTISTTTRLTRGVCSLGTVHRREPAAKWRSYSFRRCTANAAV